MQKILIGLPPENVEVIENSEETDALAQAYINAGVLSEGAKADAEHIACASVAEVDMVISWNFKHIVHYEKINGYQAINLLNGYKTIRIYSPQEVVEL